MNPFSISQRLVAELIGTAFLLATVVGSGIMAENLAGGNVAIALLGNTLPTGAILYVLITMLGPVSGAHFNPAVSLAFAIKGELSWGDFILYTALQIAGGLIGVWIAHLMFEETLIQFSEKARTGSGQWISECVATFGLVVTILAVVKFKESAVAMSVALYITAAYWFTASTSFANPAVTIARGFSNTFAGIRPVDVAPFVVAQMITAAIAVFYCRWQLNETNSESK